MKKNLKSKSILCGCLSYCLIFISGCSMLGTRTVEEISYTVEVKSGSFEIRKYPATLLAQTTTQGTYKDSQRNGFRALFKYISGGNVSDKKVAMTAPVTQTQSSLKIPMTAPVFQESKFEGWTMAFVMPSKFKEVSELPKPVDSRVKLIKRPKALYAVMTFSGWSSEKKNKDKAKELKKWLEKLGRYKLVSNPIYAGYNPPWTLPFMRRNEVMIEVSNP